MQEASLDEIQDRGGMLRRALLQQLRVMYQLRASYPCQIVLNLIILLGLFKSRSLGERGGLARENVRKEGGQNTHVVNVNH